MSDRVTKRPRVGPSEAEEEAMMKALLEGLTPGDFDITPDCSQATPPKASPHRSASAKTPLRTSHHTAASPTSAASNGRRALQTTSRSTGTRHVSIKISPKRPSSPRKSASAPGTDHMALLGLNQKAKVAASHGKHTKSSRVLSPRRKTAPLPRSPLKTEAPRPPTLSSSLTHIFQESASIGAQSTKQEPPKTPTRGSSATPPPKPIPSTPVIEDACIPPPSQESMYDDDWDLDALANMDEAELIKPVVQIKYPLPHPPIPHPPKGYAPTPWTRCTVESVHDGILDAVGGDPVPSTFHVQSLVVNTASGGQRVVQLKDQWAHIKIRQGDYVNVISPQLDAEGPIVVNLKSKSTYLIHHPDVLVTMTSMANAMPCPRRPLLQSLMRLPEPPSKAMTYGNILHALLQGSLMEQNFSPDFTKQKIEAELGDEGRRLEIWGSGLNDNDIEDDLGPAAVDAFSSFGRKWVGPDVSDRGPLITSREEVCGAATITGLHDIEEDIWSPKWGLKGKIDASVQIRLRREGSSETQDLIAPLEIKTGRSISGLSHRAQTLLYTLLMEDRYGLPIPSGLLYYSQLDSVVLIDAKEVEVRSLIMTRNELAEWMVRERQSPKAEGEAALAAEIEDVFLPEPIDNPRECMKCFASDACLLYRKSGNLPPPKDNALAEKLIENVGHLTPTHVEFFRHWERLITLEEQDTVRLRAQLWTMTAGRREKAGRCFADMVIVKEESSAQSGTATTGKRKIDGFTYTFARQSDGTAPSLLSGHIAVGDPVSLSIEPDLLCLARAYVTALSPASVELSMATKLDMTVLLARTKHEGTPVFRIDKDEMASGMASMRGNLAQLFLKGGDAIRRRLIVDLDEPKFDASGAPEPDEVPAHLNADQRTAMTQVLSTLDYSLILGMPGTGKTTTIAEIIKAIVARGKTVLLTSYTHSAVDTIVTKLLGSDFQILRLGNPQKVHRDVQHLTLDAQGPSTSVDNLEARLMAPQVVATTCLSINHALFHRRRFDYCIVDEASQITLPTCIGPLRYADKFVLVGDHFQLPPIVRKAEARAGGLDVSLFKRLSDAHPSAVVPLSSQYRMNEEIMLLSNKLIYDDRLRCGNEAIAKQALQLPHRATCADVGASTCDADCWIQGLLEEDAKAVFVDTDAVPAEETRAGDLVQNPTEAALVTQLAQALVASGVRQHDVALITPYRQQIKLISRLMAAAGLRDVEVLTADKAQGRDKDVVLVSLVRSNTAGSVGELLRDWRRINVSFTRAKKKLVVFGSQSTLNQDKLLGKFFALMAERAWIRQLPAGADSLHAWHCEEGDAEAAHSDGSDAADAKGRRRNAVVSAKMLAKHPFTAEIVESL